MQADRAKVLRLLKTARGQIDGVLKMVEEDQYCIDIVNQIMACTAVLRRAEKEILRAHVSCCVADTLRAGDQEAQDKKIDELIGVISQLTH